VVIQAEEGEHTRTYPGDLSIIGVGISRPQLSMSPLFKAPESRAQLSCRANSSHL
jgi:hypothetical protein